MADFTHNAGILEEGALVHPLNDAAFEFLRDFIKADPRPGQFRWVLQCPEQELTEKLAQRGEARLMDDPVFVQFGHIIPHSVLPALHRAAERAGFTMEETGFSRPADAPAKQA